MGHSKDDGHKINRDLHTEPNNPQTLKERQNSKTPSTLRKLDMRRKHHIKPTSKRYFKLKDSQNDYNEHFETEESD